MKVLSLTLAASIMLLSPLSLKAQSLCRLSFAPNSVLNMVRQLERSYENALFERNLDPLSKEAEIKWFRLHKRFLQRKLNQDITKFKHIENTDAFLKDMVERFYPVKTLQGIYKFKQVKEQDLKSLARVHLLNKGLNQFVENSNIPLSKKPIWKKALQAGVKYSIFTYKLFDPLRVKLNPDLAEKILTKGLENLTKEEKSEANKQYMKMYALKNAQFLSRLMSYTFLVMYYFEFEKSEEAVNQSRVVEYGEQLDELGQELNDNIGDNFLEKTKDLQLDLLLTEFKQAYGREPNAEELEFIKLHIYGVESKN